MTKPKKTGSKGGRKTQQSSSPVKLQDVAAPLETELYAKGPSSGFFLPDPSQPDVPTSTLAFNDCRGEVTLVDCSASAAGGAAEGRVTLPVQEVEGFPVVESIEWISLRPRQPSDAASQTPSIVAAIVVVRVPDDRHNDDDSSNADGGPDVLSNETQSSTSQGRPQTQLQLFRIGYSAAVDGDALIPIQPPSTQFGGGKAADGVVLEVLEDGAQELKWSLDGRYVVVDTIIEQDFHDDEEEEEEEEDDGDSDRDHDADNDDGPHKSRSNSGGHHHRTAGSSDGKGTNSNSDDDDDDDDGDSWEDDDEQQSLDIATIFQFTIHGDGTTGTLKEVAMQENRSFGNFIHFRHHHHHQHQQGEGEDVVLALYDRGNHSIELWDPTSNPDEDEDVKALLTHELPAPDPPGEDSFDMEPPLPLLEHMTTCGRGGKYIVAIDDELALLMFEVTMATPTASHHTRGGKKHHNQGKAAAEPKWELHDLLEDHPLIEMQNAGSSGPIVLQATDVTRDILSKSHTTSSDGDACYLMVTGSFSEECLLFEVKHHRAVLMYTLTPNTSEGSAAVAVESAQYSTATSSDTAGSGGLTGFTPALALAAPHHGVVLLATALDTPSETGSSSPNNKGDDHDDSDNADADEDDEGEEDMKPTAKLISIFPQRVDESRPPTNLQDQFSSVAKYTPSASATATSSAATTTTERMPVHEVAEALKGLFPTTQSHATFNQMLPVAGEEGTRTKNSIEFNVLNDRTVLVALEHVQSERAAPHSSSAGGGIVDDDVAKATPPVLVVTDRLKGTVITATVAAGKNTITMTVEWQSNSGECCSSTATTTATTDDVNSEKKEKDTWAVPIPPGTEVQKICFLPSSGGSTRDALEVYACGGPVTTATNRGNKQVVWTMSRAPGEETPPPPPPLSSAAPAPSGFGNTAATAAAPSGFGGAPATSGFGKAATAPSGFGNTATVAAPSGFGNTTATAAAPSGFGGAPATSGFGKAATAPSGFGNTATAPAGFPPAGSGLGSAPAGFGSGSSASVAGAPQAPSKQSVFGVTPSGGDAPPPASAASVFASAPAAAPGSAFGKTAAAPSVFGNTQAAAPSGPFGATAASTPFPSSGVPPKAAFKSKFG